MTTNLPTTFEEFWPLYVYEHRNRTNRALHYVGTSLAIGCVATAAVTLNPAWLVAAPVVGYGAAWVGHFLVEKNRPATFKHPLWSFRGDFRMLQYALQGKMHLEVERIVGIGDESNADRSSQTALAN